MKVLGMCFDRRALIGLAALGVAVWLLAPEYVLAVLPLLLLAACPISMGVMAWMMRKKPAVTSVSATDARTRVVQLEREQARLADEIARERTQVTVDGVERR